MKNKIILKKKKNRTLRPASMVITCKLGHTAPGPPTPCWNPDEDIICQYPRRQLANEDQQDYRKKLPIFRWTLHAEFIYESCTEFMHPCLRPCRRATPANPDEAHTQRQRDQKQFFFFFSPPSVLVSLLLFTLPPTCFIGTSPPSSLPSALPSSPKTKNYLPH